MALVAVVALVAALVQATTGLGFALVLGPAVLAAFEPEAAIFCLTILGLIRPGVRACGSRWDSPPGRWARRPA